MAENGAKTGEFNESISQAATDRVTKSLAVCFRSCSFQIDAMVQKYCRRCRGGEIEKVQKLKDDEANYRESAGKVEPN